MLVTKLPSNQMTLAEWILLPLHDVTAFSLVMIGYLIKNQASFGRTIILISFIQIFNFVLKSIWQIPLSMPLALSAQTYAFPSGHIHFYVALSLWLAWEYRSKIGGVCACLYGLAISYAEIKMGYHDLFAAIAAWCLIIIELPAYHQLCARLSYQQLPILGIAASFLAMIMLLAIPHHFPIFWLWQATFMLLSFSCGWYLEQQRTWAKRTRYSRYNTALRLIGYCLALVICQYYFHYAKNWPYPLWFNDLGYALLCFWISYGIPVTSDALVRMHKRSCPKETDPK
jgi:hypothetical protein